MRMIQYSTNSENKSVRGPCGGKNSAMSSQTTGKGTDSNTHVLTSRNGTKYTRKRRKPLTAEQRDELEKAYTSGVVGSSLALKYSRDAQEKKKAALTRLAQKTNLTVHQVRQWFSNRRKKQSLHAERVASGLSGATPFIRKGKLGKKRMEEESRQRASGAKFNPKFTNRLSTDCAGVTFTNLVKGDFSEELTASFNIIQNFFDGKLQVTRDLNDQRCEQWVRGKRQNRCKIVNFCIVLSEHYFGKQISDAVATIANQGQIPALINLIISQSGKAKDEKHFRYMIVYSAIAVYGGDRVITSLCAAMSKGFGKATTFDMESILEMLPELTDKGYRENFLKTFSVRPGGGYKKVASRKRAMDHSPNRLKLKKGKVSPSDSRSGLTLTKERSNPTVVV